MWVFGNQFPTKDPGVFNNPVDHGLPLNNFSCTHTNSCLFKTTSIQVYACKCHNKENRLTILLEVLKRAFIGNYTCEQTE